MKALLLSTNLDRPEAFLINGLIERGVEITLLLDSKSPFQELLVEQCKREFLSFKSRIDLKAIVRIRSLLRSAEPQPFDLIHSFNARALTAALVASIGLSVSHVAYRGTMGHLSRIDPSSWLGFLNPKVSRILCVSDAVRQYLRGQGIAEKRLVRIYKGHHIAWYDQITPTLLAPFGIPDSAFVVCCSANMRAVKGVDLLIDAVSLLPADSAIHLLLVGEVRDKAVQAAMQRSKCPERIHLTGFRKDALGLVKASHAFCMPSRYREGLPKAMIEAMALGVPVVVSRVGGMPEVVIDKECGMVVPAGDSHAIAQSLSSLESDRVAAQKLGARGKERIQNSFRIEDTIDQTYRTYEEVIAR